MKLSADKTRLTFVSKDQSETVLRIRPVDVNHKLWTGVDFYLKELTSEKYYSLGISPDETEFVYVISPAGHRMVCQDIFRMLNVPEEKIELRPVYNVPHTHMAHKYTDNWRTVMQTLDSESNYGLYPRFRSFIMPESLTDETYPWKHLTFAVLQPDPAVRKFLAITSFSR